MKGVLRLMRPLISHVALKTLSQHQIACVLDLFHTMVTADGTLTQQEQQAVDYELLRLPWAWNEDSEVIETLSRHSLNKVLATPQDQRLQIIKHAALGLPPGRACELVAQMLIAVACCDGLHQTEIEILDTFATHTGLSPADITQWISQFQETKPT